MKKVFFDPFCRQGPEGSGAVRVKVDSPPLLLQTSIGQLGFFAWALHPDQFSLLRALLDMDPGLQAALSRAKLHRAELARHKRALPAASASEKAPRAPLVKYGFRPKPPAEGSRRGVSVGTAAGFFAAVMASKGRAAPGSPRKQDDSCGGGGMTASRDQDQDQDNGKKKDKNSEKKKDKGKGRAAAADGKHKGRREKRGAVLDSRATKDVGRRIRLTKDFDEDISLCEKRKWGNRAGSYNRFRFAIPLSDTLACSELVKSQQGGVIPVKRKEVSFIRAVM